MSYCAPCERKNNIAKAEALNKLRERAINYAKNHGLEKILIVQTKNHPNFKRADDPEIDRFPILEVLLID